MYVFTFSDCAPCTSLHGLLPNWTIQEPRNKWIWEGIFIGTGRNTARRVIVDTTHFSRQFRTLKSAAAMGWGLQ